MQHESRVLEAVRELLGAGASGRGAAEAMMSVVTETSTLSLRNLGKWERKLRTELWQAERPSSPRWQFWNRKERFASWLDLCSADGFRRERVLRSASGGAPNGFFLALALRRLNDWVPQVRAAAREHLPHIAESSAAENVVDALWYTFAHWDSWGRIGEAERQLLLALTSIGTVASELRSRILSASAGPAAHVLSQAWRGPALDASLVDLARNAVQPAVRAKAYRGLLEGRAVWTVGRKWVWTEIQWCKGRFERVVAGRDLAKREQSVALLGAALDDPSPAVRRVAAEFVINNFDSIRIDGPTIALRLASDPNSTVAERGRYALTLVHGKV